MGLLHSEAYLNACPNPDCGFFGLIGRGNVRPHGRTGPGRINEIFFCRGCGRRFAETRGELSWRAKLTEEVIYRLLCEFRRGRSVRALARLLMLNRNTVRRYRALFQRFKLI